MKKLNVLIGGEVSQKICNEFRVLGHNAFSNDLNETYGSHPGWHIIGDMLDVSNGGKFTTQCGHIVTIKNWDLAIFHPDCKYTCWSAEWAYGDGPYHQKVKPGTLVGKERRIARKQAVEFLNKLWECNVEAICIEQSLSHYLEREWKKSTQTIHPYHFGDPFKKSTSLWMRGLKPLIPTNITWNRYPAAHRMTPSDKRSQKRAETYPGIAKAIAFQFSNQLLLTNNL